ncbi:MAG: metallophosphoesterase [Nanoarchaeota archaeon]|nr:metallophosphoesterase [Nanoarchaeota archaeon]
MKAKYKLISKTIFFPEKGILAVGDLHLGYDRFLQEQGIIIPFNQLEQSKKDLEKTIKEISKKNKIKRIILLGDVKHFFGFQKQELFDVRDFLEFLERFVDRENIILIKGNHEKFSISGYEFQDYFIDGEIAFVHGNKNFPEIFDKRIKTIVMGHMHPAILLKDKNKIKKEKFKCFLVGDYKKKKIIVVPSFFPFIEGTEYYDKFLGEDFSIIPFKKLGNFECFIIGKEKIYNFGKLKDINKE